MYGVHDAEFCGARVCDGGYYADGYGDGFGVWWDYCEAGGADWLRGWWEVCRFRGESEDVFCGLSHVMAEGEARRLLPPSEEGGRSLGLPVVKEFVSEGGL